MISIILPTMNRPGMLLRALRYYSKVGFKGSILIGDSSTGIHLNRVRDAVAIFSKVIDIKYHYIPAELGTPSPWKVKGGNVLRLLGEMVQTPYVTFAGDDDFVIPSGIDRSVNFLDRNHDYVAAHGIRVAVCVKEPGEIVWATFSREHNLESASARDRWIKFLSNPITTQFHVIRTDVWREMHRFTDTSLVSNFADELLPCSLSAAAGKIKFLDYLSTIMQVKENRALTAINTFEIIHQPDFPETYRVMKKAVSEKLAAQDCVDVSRIEKLFEERMWKYLLMQLPWQYAIRYDPHFEEKRTNSLHLLLDPASVYYKDFQAVHAAITDDLGPEPAGCNNAMASTFSTDNRSALKVNLCGGPRKIDGYVSVDISAKADFVIDLERDLLPFPDSSVDVVVCISAINYFTRKRASEIIGDVYRILREGATARFATQDLSLLVRYYLEQNREFYYQKLANGQGRFPGRTYADKLNEFFYGFPTGGDKHCQYVYDFESLRELFIEAGFNVVEEKRFQESRIPGIESIDNRPEQMFFLEAVRSNQNIENDSKIKKTGKFLRKIR